MNTNTTDGDIDAYFNSTRTDWYFGTDANPAFAEYDFVTVVLHELGHGLGFAGSSKIDDGSSANGTECDGTNGVGCYGLNSGGTFFPTIYTRFVETDDATDINTVSNPSGDVTTILEGGSLSGGSGGLFFNGSDVMTSNSGAEAKLYTPGSFTAGSSYSHFDLATFGSEIMKPSLPNGQAIHTPGMAADLLFDLGWLAAVLPVDLLHFEGFAKNASIWLDWESTDEYNNDGFEIQRSVDGKSWQTIGFKKGTNQSEGLSHYLFEDPEPFQGKNYYRLRQLDFDGSAARSKVISVELEGKQSLLSLAPNPATNNLQIQWQASSNFDKTAPYQVTGSTGNLLMSGNIEEGQKELDISSLPPGIYQLTIQTTQELLTNPFVKI